MAYLATKPGSSTAKQRQVLHQLKRRHGWSDTDLHEVIGASSTTMLSAAEASECIQRIGGARLPNPPGEKPRPSGRKRTSGVTRMITPDHEEQIERLLVEYFGDRGKGWAWLEKNFDAVCPRDLLTAVRAGQVIHVLKDMIGRGDAAQDVGV